MQVVDWSAPAANDFQFFENDLVQLSPNDKEIAVYFLEFLEDVIHVIIFLLHRIQAHIFLDDCAIFVVKFQHVQWGAVSVLPQLSVEGLRTRTYATILKIT